MNATPTPPAWLTGCAECVRLVAWLDRLLVDDGVLAQRDLDDWLEHAVDDHLAQVPGYRADCEECRTWQELSTVQQEGRGDGSTARMLVRADLRHRTRHVITARWPPDNR